MYVDYTSFQKLIATPKLELNFKRVAWVKIKKAVLSTPCRHIQEAKVLRHYREVSGQLHASSAVPLAKNPR